MSPLNSLSAEIHDRRACGNTTRQADFIINALFKGHAVLILDHYEGGRSIEANERLLNIVKGRLVHEHGLDLKKQLQVMHPMRQFNLIKLKPYR